MVINIARKHPQGTPFTDIVLVICSQCGKHEMEMHHNASRSVTDTNDAPSYHTGDTCWECFFKH